MDNNTNESPIREIHDQDFEAEVLRAQLPVLVAFGALWSRPCLLLMPVLDEVVVAVAGDVKVLAVNVDDNPDLGLWYGIHSIPTLMFFLGGKVQDKIVGMTTKEAILKKLQSVLTGGKWTPPFSDPNKLK